MYSLPYTSVFELGTIFLRRRNKNKCAEISVRFAPGQRERDVSGYFSPETKHFAIPFLMGHAARHMYVCQIALWHKQAVHNVCGFRLEKTVAFSAQPENDTGFPNLKKNKNGTGQKDRIEARIMLPLLIHPTHYRIAWCLYAHCMKFQANLAHKPLRTTIERVREAGRPHIHVECMNASASSAGPPPAGFGVALEGAYTFASIS